MSKIPENGSPGFSSAEDYTRSIPEDTGKGMPVGAPVEATDPNDDTLTYELDSDADANTIEIPEGDDVESFSIDKATGQIKLKSKLDADSGDGKYMFHVRAIDPSGETAEVEVTVTATPANDAPMIMGSLIIETIESNAQDNDPTNDTPMPDAPSELRVDEKDDDKDADPYDGTPDMVVPGTLGMPNVFTASDEDARGQIIWTLKGQGLGRLCAHQHLCRPNYHRSEGAGRTHSPQVH